MTSLRMTSWNMTSWRRPLALVALVVSLALTASAARHPKASIKQAVPPELLLDGGRKLTFERSFSLEREVKPKRSFWTRVVDVIAGLPDFHFLVNPYSITTDSHGRVIVTDPGADGIHIFDFTEKKYKFLSRKDSGKNPMLAPQCVAVDAEDNIYVTDSLAGKVFVFDPSGKFRRMIGALKGGEGLFKRPTGIAVDSAGQRIYITDTLRNKIFVMDMQGTVLSMIGKPGTGDGEFNYPTELRLNGPELFVVDAMNFRVQVLDRSGNFSLRHWQTRRFHGLDVPAERHKLRFRRPSLRCRRPVGDGASIRPARTAALLLRAAGNRLRRLSVAHRSTDR